MYPYLKLEFLPLGKILYESGQPLREIYFPIDSIISLLHVMESGESTEIALVGNEGLIGSEVLMGDVSTTSRASVQSAGHAYSLSALRLRSEFNNSSGTRMLLLRYAQSLIANMAQTAVCYRHHSIDQQVSRCLLMFLDRLPGNRVAATQQLIANLLGVRRAGVTQATGKLQKLGVIRYKRGQIMVLDRSKLEKQSCECYSEVRKETDRLEARCPIH